MNKKIFAMSFVFLLLFSSSVFALGVTSPVPKAMQLLRGETSIFEFEIQAVTSVDDMACTYYIADMAPLAVDFDSSEVTVSAGTIQKVYGTVTVPQDTPFDTYSGEITVSCGAASTKGAGSDVKTTIGGSMLNVKVVEFREAEKKTATEPASQFSNTELMLLIILIIIIVGAYYLYKNKKPAKRKRKK